MSVVASLAFIDSTFREAFELTEEARDFFTTMDGHAREHNFSSSDILLQSCEALRVTSRLTQIMAWLLVQKAVQSNEISREKARDSQYRLCEQDVCRDENLAFEGEILPGLAELLDRSLRLYQRVSRLDSEYSR